MDKSALPINIFSQIGGQTASINIGHNFEILFSGILNQFLAILKTIPVPFIVIACLFFIIIGAVSLLKQLNVL